MSKTPHRKVTPLCRIDVQRHKVFIKERQVFLTHNEFSLLSSLARAKGKVLSRQDLLEAFHESEGARDIYTRTVDQHVSRLRRKLGPDGALAVKTVSGKGYQGQPVRQQGEQVRRNHFSQSRSLQRKLERVAETEEKSGDSSPDRVPPPEDDGCQRDIAAPGGHVFRERAESRQGEGDSAKPCQRSGNRERAKTQARHGESGSPRRTGVLAAGAETQPGSGARQRPPDGKYRDR